MPNQNDFDNSDRYNPSEEAARSLLDRERNASNTDNLTPRQQRKLDRKLASADEQMRGYDPNSDDNLKNIDDARQREAALNSGFYTGRGGAEKQKTSNIKAIMKKRGPLAAILTVGLGLPTILTILFSPAMLLQQLAEVMTGEFNDQLAALDVRSTLLLKKKYSAELTKGICDPVSIRCKYQTIREGSGLAKRLRNAGIEIEGEKSLIPGRIKPTHFIYDGNRIPANKLLENAKTNPNLRSALRKGYDPIYAAFSDKNAKSIRGILGLKKSSSVKSSTDVDDMNEDLKEVAAGTDEIPPDGKKLTDTGEKDANGDPIWEDSDGNTYNDEQANRINNSIDQGFDRAKLANKVSKTAIKSSLKGALTVSAMGAGAVDSACTAWTMIRVAGFAAKQYQQLQLIRYGYEFVKIAHKQKYGDLTAEEMNFFGDKLTSTNSDGKAAMDSAGYRFAAYGDAFNPGTFNVSSSKNAADNEEAAKQVLLQNEQSRYVNGQLLNQNVMSQLISYISKGSNNVDAADKVCKFTKSWKGQALVFGLAATGLIVGIASGGLSLGAGAALQGAASVTISIALALLQPKLIDMAKGEVIKGDENGNETGNAITSGMGAYNARTAQSRGLRPATETAYASYTQETNRVAAEYAEQERSSLSPFDPTSRHTFLGSIMAEVLPYTSKQSTIGTSIVASTSLIGRTMASLVGSKTAKAASPDKYSQCDDVEYQKYNLAADPFCNVRYALPGLSTDSEAVLDKMIAGGYVTETDPTPLGDYKTYVENCITRTASIGESFNEDGGSINDGGECVIGKGGANEARNTMFAQFYIDTSIEEGMEEDFEDAAVVADTPSMTFRGATFNILHYPDGDWQARLKKSVETLEKNSVDIAGLQEARPQQQDLFKKADYGGDVYDMYPTKATNGQGPDENPDSVVIWNKSKYELVEGRQKAIKYDGGERKVNIVKLKNIENGANGPEFYVLNTHDPIDDRATSEGGPQNRYDNNKLYMETIRNELEGYPVFFAGDFNSKFTVEASGNKPLNGSRDNLAYCMLTQDDILVHASDSQQGKTGCTSEKDVLGRNDVDHIFISSTMKASNYSMAPRGSNGGDHDMVYADIEIPGGSESSGAGSTFVIGTYNQKNAISEAQHEGAMKNIVDAKMDVVGTQETSNPKFSRYKDYLGKKGYAAFPSTGPDRVNQTCASSQAIFYNKSKFTFLKGAFIEYPRYPYPPADCGGGEKTTSSHNEQGLPKVWTNTPVAWLQDSVTRQTVIVINTHGVANVKLSDGTQPAKSRYRAAQIFVQEIQKLKTENPGVPIFFTGDFNEGTNVRTSGNITYQAKQENLLFCMFAETKLMVSADGPAMKCDKSYSIGGIDYIYTTPEVKTDWVKEIASGGKDSGPPSYTDHPVKYAQVTVPGTGAPGTSPQGWVWPVPSVRTMGTLGWGEKNSDGQAHEGIDIGPKLNATVVAAHAGTVNRVWGATDRCGAYISITATGTPYFAAYQHVNPLSIKVKQGDTVTAGQEIANIGTQGGSTCGSKGFYHLHFSVEKQPGTVSVYDGPTPTSVNPLNFVKP